MGRVQTCALLLFLSVASLAPAESPDFSGSYTLVPPKNDRKSAKHTICALTVVQTADAIEVTKVLDGTSNSNKFPLDGGEGIYHSDNHAPGKCKGQLKGKRLVLDSVVVTHPLAGGPEVQLHTRERWELSRDFKTLTIHVDIDNPQLPMANIVDPWTEIYARD